MLLRLFAILSITTIINNSCSDNKKKIDDSSKIVKNDDVLRSDTNTIDIQEKKEEHQNEILEIDTTELVRIDSLSKLVFENGAAYHFIDDNCEFYFECDCCSGIYVFNDDKTFLSISNCMSDEVVRQGTYSLENFLLTLHFDNWRLDKKCNYERETDSTAVPFIYDKKEVDPFKLHYFTLKCGDRIKLTDSLEEFISIQVLTEYDETIKDLQRQNLIDEK